MLGKLGISFQKITFSNDCKQKNFGAKIFQGLFIKKQEKTTNSRVRVGSFLKLFFENLVNDITCFAVIEIFVNTARWFLT